jgi:hypothetical protein
MRKIENIIPKFSKKEIENFENENSFMDGYVELLKQTIELLYLIVGKRYCDENGEPKRITKDEAVVGGNITRLIKLNTSFLQNICERKLEICYILNRCIAETTINLQFMLLESEENVLRNYIKYSLITEKELWNTIKENIKKRNGDTLDIEIRMQKSIENSFDKSDFELEEVNRSSKWKSIAKRANLVAGEMFYNVFYGLSSHSVHGNWQDILLNNLEKDGDGFKINLKWNETRPQIMDTVIFFNLVLVKTFIEKKYPNKNEKYLEKISELFSYHNNLRIEHEKLISKR